MLYTRLIEVMLDWLETGRFPREEFRLHPALAKTFAVVVLVLAAALLDAALA